MAAVVRGALWEWQWPVRFVGQGPTLAGSKRTNTRCGSLFRRVLAVALAVAVSTRSQWSGSVTACRQPGIQQIPGRAPRAERAPVGPQQPSRAVPWAEQELHSEHNPEGSIHAGMEGSANIPFSCSSNTRTR